jgi:hypothetical protein
VLENEQIRATIAGAFTPLRCVAELWDGAQKIRFKVFDDHGGVIVEMPVLVIRTVRDERLLRELIDDVRQRIQAKGFALE